MYIINSELLFLNLLPVHRCIFKLNILFLSIEIYFKYIRNYNIINTNFLQNCNMNSVFLLESNYGSKLIKSFSFITLFLLVYQCTLRKIIYSYLTTTYL